MISVIDKLISFSDVSFIYLLHSVFILFLLSSAAAVKVFMGRFIANNEAVEKPFLQKNTLIFTAPISLHHTAII
jgi:hypothetical protein